MKQRIAFAVVLVLSLAAMGCADNAIKLRFGIESAADQLETTPGLGEARVSYVPVAAPDKAYWLVFFPARAVDPGELVKHGMPREVADQIFRQLAYVKAGSRPLLVVHQEGERLAFTNYGESGLIVADLVVERRTGPCEVVVREQDGAFHVAGVL